MIVASFQGHRTWAWEWGYRLFGAVPHRSTVNHIVLTFYFPLTLPPSLPRSLPFLPLFPSLPPSLPFPPSLSSFSPSSPPSLLPQHPPFLHFFLFSSLPPSLQDYPSVGQIAEKLREFDIIPIFAAEQSVKPFYDVRKPNLKYNLWGRGKYFVKQFIFYISSRKFECEEASSNYKTRVFGGRKLP